MPKVPTMADDAATMTTFRPNHLVRLHGFNHAALDGKLVRVGTPLGEEDGKHGVDFLDDRARPPVPTVPAVLPPPPTVPAVLPSCRRLRAKSPHGRAQRTKKHPCRSQTCPLLFSKSFGSTCSGGT